MGMLPWRQTPWEERVAPDGGAVAGAGGLEVAASQGASVTPVCPSGWECHRAMALPVLRPHAWESQQEPLGGSNYF